MLFVTGVDVDERAAWPFSVSIPVGDGDDAIPEFELVLVIIARLHGDAGLRFLRLGVVGSKTPLLFIGDLSASPTIANLASCPFS
jgi:hypothetical protein